MNKHLIHGQIIDFHNKVISLRPIIYAWWYDKFPGWYSCCILFWRGNLDPGEKPQDICLIIKKQIIHLGRIILWFNMIEKKIIWESHTLTQIYTFIIWSPCKYKYNFGVIAQTYLFYILIDWVRLGTTFNRKVIDILGVRKGKHMLWTCPTSLSTWIKCPVNCSDLATSNVVAHSNFQYLRLS